MFKNCTINSNILIGYLAGHDLSCSVNSYSRAAGIISTEKFSKVMRSPLYPLLIFFFLMERIILCLVKQIF